MAVLMIAAWSAPFSASPVDADGLGVKVTIESLRYRGADVYTLVVSIGNASSRPTAVRIDEEGFSIQTERSWAPVQVRRAPQEKPIFRLAAGAAAEREIEIKIPPDIPDAFRTDEGNLSLRYTYVYTLRAEAGGTDERKTDDVYCWVKPGTSDWILREGM